MNRLRELTLQGEDAMKKDNKPIIIITEIKSEDCITVSGKTSITKVGIVSKK